MSLYIHHAAIAEADEANWYALVQHAQRPEVGYRLTLATATNVRGIKTIEEGLAYSAYFPAYEPTAENSLANETGGNRNYHSMDDDGDYADWTVAAGGAGITVVVVSYVQVSGAGTLQLVKNPAGAATVIGEVATTGATTVYTSESEVTLSESLAAGDVLRFRRKTGTGTVRLCYWHGAIAPATYATPTFVVIGRTQLTPNDVSIECAYQVAPTGSAVKWVGGYYHQGGTYATETSPAVTWANAGAVFTPAAGYTTGEVQLYRLSDVDYDGSPTVIGTLESQYVFAQKYFTVATKFTASANLDLGAQYACMAPVKPTVFTMSRTNLWLAANVATADDTNVSVAAGKLAATRDWYCWDTPQRAKYHVDLIYRSNALASAFTRRSSGQGKWYCDVKPGTTAVSGNSWGGKWLCEFTSLGPSIGGNRNSLIRLAPARQMRKPPTIESSAPTLWLAADHGVFVADGAGVANLLSKDGRLRHFVQATESKQPTLDVDGLASLPALTFAAAGEQYLQLTADILTGTAGRVFVVASVTASAVEKNLLCVGNAASAAFVWTVRSLDSEKANILFQNNVGSNYNTITGGTIQTALCLYEFGSTGTVYDIAINGVAETLTVAGTGGVNDGSWAGDLTTRTHCAVGARVRNAADQFYNGKIAEIVYYDTEPSVSVIKAVRTALMAKYGLA